MSVTLYMDEHVPSAITTGLRLRRIEVLTVFEDGYDGRDDPEVLDRAGDLVRAFFTFDEDFLIETSRRTKVRLEFAPVIRAHLQEITSASALMSLN